MSSRQGLRPRNQNAQPRAQSAAPDTPTHPHAYNAQPSPPAFGRGIGRGLLDSPFSAGRNVVAGYLRATLRNTVQKELSRVSVSAYTLPEPGVALAPEAWSKISNITGILVTMGALVKQRNGEFLVADGLSDTFAQEILSRFCLQDFHTREHVRMHVPEIPTKNWTSLVNMVIEPYRTTKDVLSILAAFHAFFAPAQLKSLRGLSHYIQSFASKLHEFEISMRNISAFPGTQVVEAFLQTLASMSSTSSKTLFAQQAKASLICAIFRKSLSTRLLASAFAIFARLWRSLFARPIKWNIVFLGHVVVFMPTRSLSMCFPCMLGPQPRSMRSSIRCRMSRSGHFPL